MTVTSTRGKRLNDGQSPVEPTGAAGFFDGRPARERASRWVAAIYFIIALATPFLLYAGPEVLSPAAPVIADHAVDGTFVYPPHVAHHN
jgi:hypothetical protein